MCIAQAIGMCNVFGKVLDLVNFLIAATMKLGKNINIEVDEYLPKSSIKPYRALNARSNYGKYYEFTMSSRKFRLNLYMKRYLMPYTYFATIKLSSVAYPYHPHDQTPLCKHCSL
jgi:hypothetical protein